MEKKRIENQKRHFNYVIEEMIKTNIESINMYNSVIAKSAAEYTGRTFESTRYDVNDAIKVMMEGLNTENMSNSQTETIIQLMEMAFEAGDKKKFIEFFRGGNLNSENIWDTVLEDVIEEEEKLFN